MVIFDMPYGVFNTKDVPWDVRLTREAMITLIQQLAAVVRNDNCLGWFWVHPAQYGEISECLQAGGWRNQVPFCWYKPNANVHGCLKYIPSWELALVATKGDKNKAWQHWSTDYKDRHNHVTMPGITSLYKHEGKVVNPTQKPVQLMQEVIQRHCPPGSTVLVIGFGSGTDLIASFAARCHVIGIESDELQFQAGLSRLRAFVDSQLQPPKSKKPAGEVEADASQSPKEPEAGKEPQGAEGEPQTPCVQCGKADGVRAECAHCRAWFHKEQDECGFVCEECLAEHGDRLFERKSCHDAFYEENADVYPFHSKHKHLAVSFCVFFSFCLFDLIDWLARLDIAPAL